MLKAVAVCVLIAASAARATDPQIQAALDSVAHYQERVTFWNGMLATYQPTLQDSVRQVVQDAIDACANCGALGMVAEADSITWEYVRIRFATAEEAGNLDLMVRGAIGEYVEAEADVLWGQRVIRARLDRALRGIARLNGL